MQAALASSPGSHCILSKVQNYHEVCDYIDIENFTNNNLEKEFVYGHSPPSPAPPSFLQAKSDSSSYSQENNICCDIQPSLSSLPKLTTDKLEKRPDTTTITKYSAYKQKRHNTDL